MNKKLILLCSAVLVLLSFAATAQFTQAVDYTRIGVWVGARADYSNDGGVFSDRMRIEVTEVRSVIVNLTLTDYWANGTTVRVHQQSGNVSSGGLLYWLFCAGLQKGDPLYAGAIWSFNDTITMEFAGEARSVNVVSFPGNSFYYDQVTGIMVKMVFPRGNYSMISTNMWGPVDPAVLILIGGGAAAVAVVAAVALLYKRSK